MRKGWGEAYDKQVGVLDKHQRVKIEEMRMKSRKHLKPNLVHAHLSGPWNG